jgi:plasmid stability protein
MLSHFLCWYQRYQFAEDAIMPAVTIRNLSEEAHRALKVRAAQHNRSTEAEMRAILEAAVRPEGRLKIGTALSEMSRKIGLTNADVEALEQTRDTRPAEPMRFE